jgi:hypothetical protein
MYGQPQQYYPMAQQYQWGYTQQPQQWYTPTVPSNVVDPQQQQQLQQQSDVTSFPRYSEPSLGYSSPELAIAGPSRTSTGYLSPEEPSRTRISRTTSFASNASSARSYSHSDVSRSTSPSASEMAKWVRTRQIPFALISVRGMSWMVRPQRTNAARRQRLCDERLTLRKAFGRVYRLPRFLLHPSFLLPC